MEISTNDFIDKLYFYIKKSNIESIVGVSGGGASGKSTICKKLMDRIGNEAKNYLNTDSYLIESPTRERLRWEGSYDGKKINGRITACCPEGTFFPALNRDIKGLKHGFPMLTIEDNGSPTFLINPVESITIVEGIAVAFVPSSYFDISIFLYCDAETEWERRLSRDKIERNIDTSSIQKDFFVRRAQFEQYIKPKEKCFNLVLKSTKDYSLILEKDSLKIF